MDRVNLRSAYKSVANDNADRILESVGEAVATKEAQLDSAFSEGQQAEANAQRAAQPKKKVWRMCALASLCSALKLSCTR